jgi:hypothetical protein
VVKNVDIDTFTKKLKELSDLGFIESHRTGDTGIGKTLEDRLGIKENNISGPDFSVYELKSTRRQSTTMVTLFTKTPSPKGAIKELVDNFGYRHRKGPSKTKQTTLVAVEDKTEYIQSEEKELHVTVDAIKPNSVGLQLYFVGERLYFKNAKGIVAYYDRGALEKAFEKKYHSMIYVIADCRKEGKQEMFWYNEAYRLDGFGFATFAQLIKEGLLKADIRVGHYPDGRVHDHGTAFRILPIHLPKCFEVIDCILEPPKTSQGIPTSN